MPITLRAAGDPAAAPSPGFAGLGRFLGIADRLLDADGLIRRGGATPADLAAYDAEAPLRLLLRDYRRHAALTLVGSFAARYDTLRLLRNLAAMRGREAAQPGILAAPIAAPVFVTGFPRSGSTFLHRLLMQDPAVRVPAVWETIFPLPDGPRDTVARRIARVDRQLRTFERMAPGFRDIHPLDATSPQECTEILAHVFRSYRFETTHALPEYRAWLRGADHVPAYRLHRAYLQHLQHGEPRRRWVLKSPEHVFTLEALAAVYPDARIVFLHRDPVKVLASVAGMTAVLRKPFTRSVDRAAIGRQVAADWLDGANAMVRAQDAALFPPGRVAHVQFEDLTAAPMRTVEDIYARFGLPLDDAARAGFAARIAAVPRGGYAGVRYDVADYGIDPAEQRALFKPYTDRFGVRVGG